MSPERTCVVCRTAREKDSLLRVARARGGTLAVGTVAPGRGAYVCRDPACIRDAVGKGGLARALRSRLSEADLARLGEQLTKELG